MGSLLSMYAQPPDVDLLPPKFDRRATPLDKLPLSPISEYMFGVERRDKLFSNFYAQPGGLRVLGAFRPDYEEKASVTLQSEVTAAVTENGSVTVGYTDMDTQPAYQGQVRLSADGGMRAAVGAWDPEGGTGWYALLPGEYFLGGRAAELARDATASVGFGVGGRPTRYSHLATAKPALQLAPTAARAGGGDSAASASAAALADHDPASAAAVVSPRAVTAPPVDAAEGGGSGGRAAPQQPVLPELGARFVSASQRVSAGMHTSPFEPFPTKLWAVGSMDGKVTAGVQVSSNAIRLSAPAPGDRFDVDAAVSISQEPTFELSLALDGARREVVAGYVHNMTVRRNVRNPLEARHVKGIYNYLDIGFEFRRTVDAPYASALAVGAAWQVNKNTLLKARVGSRDASVSAAFKSWWDPAATLCLTSTYDRHAGTTALGAFFSLEKGGGLQYQKAVQGYQVAPQSRQLRAAPQLNERMSRDVDPRPFEPPPRGGGGPGGSAGGFPRDAGPALGSRFL
jgi:hypothetical protein